MLIAMVQFPASYLIHTPRYDVFHFTMDTFPSFMLHASHDPVLPYTLLHVLPWC